MTDALTSKALLDENKQKIEITFKNKFALPTTVQVSDTIEDDDCNSKDNSKVPLTTSQFNRTAAFSLKRIRDFMQSTVEIDSDNKNLTS